MYRVDRFGNPLDWNEAAADAAERIGAHLPHVDRGAVSWWNRELSVVFGKDGGQGQLVVHLLRQVLADLNIKEMGLGLSSDRDTWAIIVSSPDTARLAAEVADAWRIAQGTRADHPMRRALAGAGVGDWQGDHHDPCDEHPEVAD